MVSKVTLKQTIKKLECIISNRKKMAKSEDTIQQGNIKISPLTGLCSNALFPLSKRDPQYVNSLFKQWKHYSGVDRYPITIDGEDPRFLYNSANLYYGRFGKKRIKLAKYLIKCIKKDLKSRKETKDE